jgi:hypothetical protein
MNLDSNQVINGNTGSMRITRIVSVILNGVVLQKLAIQNGNNVDAIADTLMSNMSDRVRKNIHSHEFSHVNNSLRMEIGRRINLPQAV